MREFAEVNFDRFNAKLKEIRNILLAIVDFRARGEVLVGQAIAKLVRGTRNRGRWCQTLPRRKIVHQAAQPLKYCLRSSLSN